MHELTQFVSISAFYGADVHNISLFLLHQTHWKHPKPPYILTAWSTLKGFDVGLHCGQPYWGAVSPAQHIALMSMWHCRVELSCGDVLWHLFKQTHFICQIFSHVTPRIGQRSSCLLFLVVGFRLLHKMMINPSNESLKQHIWLWR